MPTIQFKGKSFVQNYHLAVKYHQLVPRKELSLTDKVSLHDNLIIQGDNLKALKALLPNYAGKITCIFIDPPYNTGSENWRYLCPQKFPAGPRSHIKTQRQRHRCWPLAPLYWPPSR
jgi:hypothetical protein